MGSLINGIEVGGLYRRPPSLAGACFSKAALASITFVAVPISDELPVLGRSRGDVDPITPLSEMRFCRVKNIEIIYTPPYINGSCSVGGLIGEVTWDLYRCAPFGSFWPNEHFHCRPTIWIVEICSQFCLKMYPPPIDFYDHISWWRSTTICPLGLYDDCRPRPLHIEISKENKRSLCGDERLPAGFYRAFHMRGVTAQLYCLVDADYKDKYRGEK